jgi:hypothetical protein
LLIAAQQQIGRLGALALAGYVAAATAIYSVVDSYYYNEDSLYWLTAIIVWGLGYLLLVHLMRVNGPAGEQHFGGVGGYFALGLFAGIAIVVGVILFIIPGLYLMMRWLPAYARYQHAGTDVVGAIRWSWEHTEDIQLPLFLALIGPVLMLAAALTFSIANAFYLHDIIDPTSIWPFWVINLLSSLSVAWTQLLGVAAYRVIQRHHSVPVETFE